jgi:hypothetical protein
VPKAPPGRKETGSVTSWSKLRLAFPIQNKEPPLARTMHGYFIEGAIDEQSQGES